ncbi:hypothetical protein TRVA0_001S03642 [Trichomonascus vanleenenianus]|uniref:alpha-hydroxy acid oxidase n=1 Tax=Trichomonascus vanleenenianus TaxID=2268995 RepID=UPI003EC955C1
MPPAPEKIMCLQDLERVSMPMAQKQARDYWESGANDMVTVRENITAYNQYRIRARAMRNVAHVDAKPRTKLFGKEYAVPIGFAPSAFHQMATDEGEVATAKAAKSCNIPMGLSSYANRSHQDVKQAGGDSAVFFQLYVFKNRKTTEKLVRAVEKSGYKALLLTVDTPYLGQRYSDTRNNFKLPTHLKLGNFAGEVPGLIDVGTEATSGSRMAFDDAAVAQAQSEANVVDPSINWAETIPWLRSISNLEIWVKGITTYEDAQLAVEAGVDGIWVSNHGGRQLDNTLATIDSLPEVVEAVKGRIPVHIDGGIRKGTDVFKALALGADFVWLGRPVLHGLQYDGQAGVELMHGLISKEFKYVMALSGCHNTSEITKKTLVRVGPGVSKL